MDVKQRDRDDTLDAALPTNRIPGRSRRDNIASTPSSWHPEAGAGQIIGAVLFLIGLAIVLVALSRAGGSAGLLRGFWILLGLAATLAAICVAVLVVRLRSITYTLEGSGLIVSAVGLRLMVPYNEIVDVVFRPRDVIDTRGYERFWQGFYDSHQPTSEGGWRSVATTPPAERVRIRLQSGVTIAISPERPVLFVEALQMYRHGRPDSWARARNTAPAPTAGVTPNAPVHETASTAAETTTGTRRPRVTRTWLRWPVAIQLFRERIVRGDQVASSLLALNLIALIVLVTIASWRSDAINSPLPVHWDTNGEPTWFVSPNGFWVFEGIWIYPLTAAAMIAVNSALATLAAVAGRLPEARLLLSASCVTTLLLLIGLWRTTGTSLPVLG